MSYTSPESYAKHKQELLVNGYTKIEGFLSQNELDQLLLKSHATLFRTSDLHRERFKSNGTLCNFVDHPELADLAVNPKVNSLLSAFFDDADPVWSGGFLISKPGGGAPLFWHQDWWGWDADISYEETPVQLFFMYYLVDTNEGNGCLRVIPGSHRQPHALHTTIAAHDENLARAKNLDSVAFQDSPEQVPVRVKAGDLLVGDARLIHGAYANKTENERPLLTLWYIPCFSSLPENIQARIQAMYAGDDTLDVSSAQEKSNKYSDWPEFLFSVIKDHVPRYSGNATPIGWNRIPDTSKMKSPK